MADDLAVLASDEDLRRRLGRNPVWSPEAYHRILADLMSEVDVWETEYLQVLDGERTVELSVVRRHRPAGQP